jgi:alkanesulfonate monooxygenase SsuD/methylene tetrahydromethanopterin reductase-like flavin-dependent oxidoreductase (luciferase family)
LRLEITLSSFDAAMGPLAEAASFADEQGISGLWMMDHLTGNVHPGRTTVLECLASLAALATSTRDCRIGSLVINPVLRHPVVLAQALASLQDQSNGRLVVGIGAGGGGGQYGVELVESGFIDHPAAVRRARVEETIAILHHTWSGATTAWDGPLYRFGGSVGFLRPLVAPPVILGGYGSRMASLAGRWCSGFNTAAGHRNVVALSQTARAAHVAAEVDGPFEVSAFAAFEPAWLDVGSEQHRRLAEADIDVLILVVPAPHDHGLIKEIASAARSID